MAILRREKEKKTERRLILSIDGGGMRGIIPSWILGRINEELRKKGDRRPLYSHFDLIAGTSTGALIAASMSIPTEGTSLPKEDTEESEVYQERIEGRFFKKTIRTFRGSIIPSSDPASFTTFYIENGARIFPQKSVGAIIGPLFTDKYSGTEYERFLQGLYGNATMGELMVPTALLSYSSDNGIIFPITSWDTPEFMVWEGARASSAAPLYFPPFSKTYKERKYKLIDGGVAANNPSLVAYALGRKLYPAASEFEILSLSTGAPIYKTHEQLGGGLTGWGKDISRIFQNAELQVADTVLPAISGLKYTRIWSPALDRKIKLDETGKESIRTLLSAAARIYEDNKDAISAWVEMLASSPVSDMVRLRGREESHQPLLP